MAEVILEHVMKVYAGGVKAVDDANLHINDGAFVVLVGPSGCGKSTTLRMIAGLEEITGGIIRIGEKVVNQELPKDRDIAMVFQDYALYPHMSVYQNMAFGLKLRKYPRPEIDKRVRDASKVLGLDPLLNRTPRELSGGQRQRVALGRAIVRQPKVFLFDEPLSNLDAKLRVEMRAELKRLHRQLSTTTVYVTHDQEEAMTLGEVVVVMKDGLIQQVGAPLDIYWSPVNRFVASFLGTPPMNFLNGSIIEQGGKFYFDAGLRKLLIPDKHAQYLRGKANSSAVMGVRPEAISFHAEGRFTGPENILPASIIVSEPLGEKIDVYLQLATHEKHVVARVEAQKGLKDGEEIAMYIDMDRIHIFEPGDFGLNLLKDSGAVLPAVKPTATA
jgi:multiple sugar transport system ATP-binding protein